jgi:HTH-type transcriptional regulator/antitoxin HipB
MPPKQKLKSYTLEEIKDEMIGKKGSPSREHYEYELQIDIMGKWIRQIRRQRRLTQQDLGDLIGIQKSQISKLENNTTNVSIETLLKVFKALRAKLIFRYELQE